MMTRDGGRNREQVEFTSLDPVKLIKQKILNECIEAGLVDERVVFVDSTHVKARANSKKYRDTVVEEQAHWYEKELQEEINRDREAHGFETNPLLA